MIRVIDIPEEFPGHAKMKHSAGRTGSNIMNSYVLKSESDEWLVTKQDKVSCEFEDVVIELLLNQFLKKLGFDVKEVALGITPSKKFYALSSVSGIPDDRMSDIHKYYQGDSVMIYDYNQFAKFIVNSARGFRDSRIVENLERYEGTMLADLISAQRFRSTNWTFASDCDGIVWLCGFNSRSGLWDNVNNVGRAFENVAEMRDLIKKDWIQSADGNWRFSDIAEIYRGVWKPHLKDMYDALQFASTTVFTIKPDKVKFVDLATVLMTARLAYFIEERTPENALEFALNLNGVFFEDMDKEYKRVIAKKASQQIYTNEFSRD